MGLKTCDTIPLNHVHNVIGVMAGKGGVGKSTIAVNLARALSLMGQRVGILDADIYGPSLKMMLGVQEMPTSKEGWILPLITPAHHLKVMSLSFFKQGEAANAVRAPIANSIISQFIHDVKWGELDTLIVDFPPGTGDIQLTLMQQIKFAGALFVSTPQRVAVLDVKKAIEMAHNMGVPIIGVIENMSYFQERNQSLFGRSYISDLNTPCLVRLPLEGLLSTAGDLGQSIFESHPESQVVSLFFDMGDQIDQFCAKNGNITKMVTEIKQLNPYTLELTFKDGKRLQYTLKELQHQCPCARCSEHGGSSHDQVMAHSIRQIGRYAIQIDFSSGCSNGIYSYQYLRELA